MILPNDPTPPASTSHVIIDLSGQTPPPIDQEFSPPAVTNIIESFGLGRGRCLGSKSGYRQFHEKHFFVPNANAFTKQHGKIWWGDLDLWTDAELLDWAAKRLRTRIFVLSEFDGRFNNQDLPYRTILERAIWRSGGERSVDRRLMENSGLTVSDLELLMVGVSSLHFTTPQIPYIALQIERRIRAFRRLFSPVARRLKLKHWGDWFNRPLADGRSPLTILKIGDDLELMGLEPELNFSRLLCFPRAAVDLGWPKVSGAPPHT